MTFRAALEGALGELGVEASASQMELMRAHFALLRKWNRRINLTAIRGPREAAYRHFGEAAFLHRELPEANSVVDVGSGGGFPGLPLAVLRPGTPVTLVESRLRKAAFLKEASRACPNVTVAHCRIEAWPGRADWAVLRAVAPESVLPALSGRSLHAAILGTESPPEGAFGGWRTRKTPWSLRRRLWLGNSLRDCPGTPDLGWGQGSAGTQGVG